MLKMILLALLPFLMVPGTNSDDALTWLNQTGAQGNFGTLEKLIVATGSVTMDLSLNRLNRTGNVKEQDLNVLGFDVERDSFFKVLVFNGELRGPLPGSMELIPRNSAALPSKMNDSHGQMVIEKTEWGEPYELVVRDGKTGFVFFNIEGPEYEYNPAEHLLSVKTGRLLLSKDFARELGHPAEVGTIVGQISIRVTLRPIEVTQVVNDEIRSDVLPSQPSVGSVPGPDVIVGDLSGLTQPDAASGTQVGLAVGTDSCNLGTVDLDWFATPDNDHPVIPQNFYRMSGGATNDARFEQIGQSNVKHAFMALTQDLCSLGCNGVGGTHLGSGCSDPYFASLNSGGSGHTLGSRAWINPFTGAFPRADSATPPNSHTGHTHNGTSHRILVEVNDLNTSMNAGATYYAEAQYITPHEFVWCQAHPGQCNQYNNVSYRQYTVSGTSSPFTFAPAASTVQSKPALAAWTGSSSVQFNPDPGNDGIGSISYKITNTSPGIWHYEYAVYNQNLDRAIQSFSIPVDAGVALSNIGFHAPPQQPGWTADGTAGNAGYSSTPWAQTQAAGALIWNSETFAQNQNANAIRWGTLYNFRFDSDRAPQTTIATIGFFKTGAPVVVQVQGPTAAPVVVVSGRVTTSGGRGVFYARVSITDASNNVRYAITNPFGYYRFTNVAPGGMYTIAVLSKHHTFTPQALQINNNLTNVNFVSVP